MRRRHFLAGCVGLSVAQAGPALAQRPPSPSPSPSAERERLSRETRAAAPVTTRRVRTVPLFQSPEGYPNAIDATPEGLWIGEQLTPEGVGSSNDAYLVDWSGKVLRKVRTDSRNTSGLAFGADHLWMGANAAPHGIFKTALDGRTVAHRQIPLGPPDHGGGCHGVLYHNGKLYITALRLRGILRVDGESWQPELLIPCAAPRLHDLAWDDGTIWIVTGSSNTDPDFTPGLARYDAATGWLLETAMFEPGSADPHGLTIWNGVMYGCDAGIHPGWPARHSPSSGFIYRMEFV